ncbi:MAG: hypothetical protein WC310_02170 [Patescibacteria group bacterium]|jgi:hypothetical protein
MSDLPYHQILLNEAQEAFDGLNTIDPGAQLALWANKLGRLELACSVFSQGRLKKQDLEAVLSVLEKLSQTPLSEQLITMHRILIGEPLNFAIKSLRELIADTTTAEAEDIFH